MTPLSSTELMFAAVWRGVKHGFMYSAIPFSYFRIVRAEGYICLGSIARIGNAKFH